MEIRKDFYNNNLLFYTILKNLTKCRLTENKMQQLKYLISENRNLETDLLIESLSIQVVNEKVKTYDDYITLINLCNENNHFLWCDLVILSIELLLSKNLILEESKGYAKKDYNEEVSSIEDELSFDYDLVNLERPYSQRVIGALLVYALTDTARNDELFLNTCGKSISVLREMILEVTKKYKINVNNIFMIAMDESINQSIISTAGSSYESRVENVLSRISTNVKQRVHDKFITSVEYDFTFELNKKIYGVSAKRTLRERYKQNFEDVNLLSVEAMFLITLGIDLNEEKLNNIMQRHGYFVVVSQEVYESHSYFKKNKRVISSKNFNKEFLEKLFNQFI